MPNTLTSADVLEFLATADLDMVDEVADMVSIRRKHLAQKFKRALEVGDTVTFMGKKNSPRANLNGKQTGEVVKIMRKNVKVRVGFTTWTVSPNLLTKVDG